MKLFGLLISTINPFFVFGQNQTSIGTTKTLDSKFSLTFTMFNHAEWLLNGTTTYQLTDTTIKVINTSFGEKNGRILFSKKFLTSENPVYVINNLGLDSLKDYYFNYCIMTTSGDEYFLDVKSSLITKNIRLHHYYLKQLDDIIQLINSLLPEKYQFKYLPRNEKQDCSFR